VIAALKGSKRAEPLPVLTKAPHVGIPLATPAPFSHHHTLLMLHQICQQLKHTCQPCLITCISANRRSHRHGSPNSATFLLNCCTCTVCACKGVESLQDELESYEVLTMAVENVYLQSHKVYWQQQPHSTCKSITAALVCSTAQLSLLQSQW